MQQSRVVSKVLSLTKRGSDCPERLRNKIGGWIGYLSPSSSINVVHEPSTLEADVAGLFQRSASHSMSESFWSVKRHVNDQQSSTPFGSVHNGTKTLGELCYLISTYLRPDRVVETGVAHGVTSTYILQALADNGLGTLHSIDLPPLVMDAEKHVGSLIPSALRGRWRLTIGSARKVLPDVLRTVGPIDLFVHDSLHTYSHMKWEFEAALRSLRPGGVLIADDIEGNRAFEEIARHPSIAAWMAIRQEGKNALCGVLRTRT